MMKNSFVFLISIFLFCQAVWGLGSTFEFGLGSRGELVLSTSPRSHDEIDFNAFLAMESSFIENLSGSDDDTIKQMIEEVITDYELYDPNRSSEEDKVYYANRMRERLLTLKEAHPDLFAKVEEDLQRREGYYFSSEGLPRYCENYPSITRDDLQIFYSGSAESPDDPLCSRRVGEYIVNNDLGHISKVMRNIQNESFASEILDFRSMMMSEVAKGILHQRGIYGGLDGTAQSHYPACFVNSNDFNEENFKSSLNNSFNTAKAEGAQRNSSSSRESLIRSSIESIVYQQVLRAYQENALPPHPVKANPGMYHCRTILALKEGISFDGVTINTISNCHNNRINTLSFQNNEQCVAAHNTIVNGERQKEFQACVEQNQNGGVHHNSFDQVESILTKQIQETPLLFGRDKLGLGNDYISSMGRSIAAMDGMNDVIRNMIPHMQDGVLNFNKNFNALLKENESAIETLYQKALASSDINQVIDKEIKDYQESLDLSLNKMCENGGKNLHHIPELVEQVRTDMVATATGEEEREEALVRAQRLECHLLRDIPPSDMGGIHPAVYYLGIAGGIALSFTNPLVGAAVMLTVEGANGYSTISTAQGQLEDILSSTHAGFSSPERLTKARENKDGAVSDLVLTAAGELAGVGLIDDAVRVARTVRARGNEVPSNTSAVRPPRDIDLNSLNLDSATFLDEGSFKKTYDLGDGRVALIYKQYDGQRRDIPNIDHDSFVKRDIEELMALERRFDGVMYGDRPIFTGIDELIRDSDGEIVGFTSQKIEGVALDNLLETDTLSNGETLEVMRQLRDQLGIIYDNNLYHGDLHAGNIMIHRGTDGKIEARLIDFTIVPEGYEISSNIEYSGFNFIMEEMLKYRHVPEELPSASSVSPWVTHHDRLKTVDGLDLPPITNENGRLNIRTSQIGPYETYENKLVDIYFKMGAVEFSDAENLLLKELAKVAKSVSDIIGDTNAVSKLSSDSDKTRIKELLRLGHLFGRTEDGRTVLVSLPGE